MKAARPYFLIDLDRTLLDTNRYTKALWQQVQRWINGDIDPDREYDHIKDYYLALEGGRAYSFTTHLKAVLPKDSDIPSVLDTLLKHFNNAESCLYPHAVELMGNLANSGKTDILTFGFEADQAAKLGRLPSLTLSAESVIIQENKPDYIRRRYGTEREVWLIDNTPYTALPNNCRQIQVDHTGQAVSNDTLPVAHDLETAEKYIMKYYGHH